MKKPLDFAPEVIFDEAKHTYTLRGKKLSGVTGIIAKRLGIRMPEDFVGEARQEGLHIHKAVQNWITDGTFESIHPGAMWIKDHVERVWQDPLASCHSEVLITDFKKFASSVDIIGITEAGTLVLYDIKRTFKRTYVTWQLSIYKYFIEKYTSYKVEQCYCLAVKDRVLYPVFARAAKDIEALLYKKD